MSEAKRNSSGILTYEADCPKCGQRTKVGLFGEGSSAGGWYAMLHVQRNGIGDCGEGLTVPMPGPDAPTMALCISRLEALERELEGIGGGG